MLVTSLGLVGAPTRKPVGRCFYLAKSYSSAGKRAEAYALYCHARLLVDAVLKKLQSVADPDKVITFN